MLIRRVMFALCAWHVLLLFLGWAKQHTKRSTRTGRTRRRAPLAHTQAFRRDACGGSQRAGAEASAGWAECQTTTGCRSQGVLRCARAGATQPTQTEQIARAGRQNLPLCWKCGPENKLLESSLRTGRVTASIGLPETFSFTRSACMRRESADISPLMHNESSYPPICTGAAPMGGRVAPSEAGVRRSEAGEASGTGRYVCCCNLRCVNDDLAALASLCNGVHCLRARQIW